MCVDAKFPWCSSLRSKNAKTYYYFGGLFPSCVISSWFHHFLFLVHNVFGSQKEATTKRSSSFNPVESCWQQVSLKTPWTQLRSWKLSLQFGAISVVNWSSMFMLHSLVPMFKGAAEKAPEVYSQHQYYFPQILENVNAVSSYYDLVLRFSIFEISNVTK